MKFRFLILSMLVFINVAFGQEEKAQNSPLDIVNKRMKFYNQHNYDQFIQLYAQDVKVYTYPSKLIGNGIENIISIFKPKFETKSISVQIINQIENGNHVINHEIVTENGLLTKYVSIYQIENGLIKNVRFVRDN